MIISQSAKVPRLWWLPMNPPHPPWLWRFYSSGAVAGESNSTNPEKDGADG